MNRRKQIVFVLAAVVLCVLACACSNENERVIQAAKDTIYSQISDTIKNVALSTGIDDSGVLDSLRIDYSEETIKKNEITLVGEISYVVADQKYFQPFQMIINLKDDNKTETIMGEMRVEEASAAEASRFDSVMDAGKLSDSEIQEIVEAEVLNAAIEEMESDEYRYAWCNLDATRYEIGKITKDGDRYEVKGTLALYNDYGEYRETITFDATVRIDDYGHVSHSNCWLGD